MIEVWLQVTCNGCGSTTNSGLPNTTKADYRASLRTYGWRVAPGGKDYCRDCVRLGKAAKGVNIFAIGTGNDGTQAH